MPDTITEKYGHIYKLSYQHLFNICYTCALQVPIKLYSRYISKVYLAVFL